MLFRSRCRSGPKKCDLRPRFGRTSTESACTPAHLLPGFTPTWHPVQGSRRAAERSSSARLNGHGDVVDAGAAQSIGRLKPVVNGRLSLRRKAPASGWRVAQPSPACCACDVQVVDLRVELLPRRLRLQVRIPLVARGAELAVQVRSWGLRFRRARPRHSGSDLEQKSGRRVARSRIAIGTTDPRPIPARIVSGFFPLEPF